MPGDDFIILPNGQKLYLKDEYGAVNSDKLKNKSSELIIWNYDENNNGSLSASEIRSIFNAIKTKAQENDDNKLSEKELSEFIKEEQLSAEQKGRVFHKIKPKDVMKFLLNLQEVSQKNLEQLSEPEPTHNLTEVFPELSILDLGDDRHIDTSKLSFEYVREKLFSDSERYEFVTERKMVTDAKDNNGNLLPPFECDVLKIIDKQTKNEVLSYDESSQELLISDGNYSFLKIKKHENEYSIEKITKSGAMYLNNAKISNEKLECLNDGQGNVTEYQNGIVNTVRHYESGLTTTNYSNGQEIRTTDEKDKLVQSAEAVAMSKIVNSDKPEDIKKLEQFLNNSFNENRLEQTMDDYYATTGIELFDDIKKSKLPDDVKNKFLKEMCEPFVDSEFYNAYLSVESSQIQSKYYTGDDYSIKYNGPVVMVKNKNTGEETRINLKNLFKYYNFTDRGRRTQKLLAYDLKAIQSFSGEDLENIGIEISSIRYANPRSLRKDDAAAFYCDFNESITIPRIYKGKNAGTNIHELGHAIDSISDKNGAKSYLSTEGRFKARYEEYIAEWEAKGHKRFDFEHAESLRRIIMAIFKGTDDYATFNELEAFAICMSGILGKPDSSFKYVEQNFPDLIDLAKEIYLEVRSLNREQRNPKN